MGRIAVAEHRLPGTLPVCAGIGVETRTTEAPNGTHVQFDLGALFAGASSTSIVSTDPLMQRAVRACEKEIDLEVG